MKKTIKLFLIAGLALLAFSCQKMDNFSGREIRFSASANPSTKTAYGDYSGQQTTYGNFPFDPDHQAINWVSGDQIRIWSDQAVKRGTEDNPVHYADYNLVEINGSTAKLDNPIGAGNVPESGLTYIDGVESYDFEAYYPATGISIDASTNARSYTIPNQQSPKSVITDGVVISSPEVPDVQFPFDVLTPDMSKAFMLAYAPNCPWKPEGNYDQTINLQFYPGFTAFEIYIIAGPNHPIKGASEDAGGGNDNTNPVSVGLSSVKFITSPDPEPSAGKAPSVTGGLAGKVLPTFSSTGTSFDYSNVGDLTYTFPTGTTVTTSKGLVFTVFALPKTIQGMSLEFHLSDGQIRTATLFETVLQDDVPTTQPITFAACKKNRLYILAIPSGFYMFTTEEKLLVAAHQASEEPIVL